MSDTESQLSKANKRNYKVGRVLEDYDLLSLDKKLDEMWLGTDSQEPYSLRELSDHINKQLLRTAMERADIDPLDGETEETYRILTDDDIDEIVCENTVRRLEREGVEVEQLESDFVTHQSVHTYLTKFRNTKRETRERDEVSVGEELEAELTRDAKESLDSFVREGRISLGDFELDLDVRVHCEDCTQTYTLEELLSEGRCNCDEPL